MSWRSILAPAGRASPPEQLAVMDLGSNSWRLVVFSYLPGAWWKRTDELYETVRIGAGVEASGRIGGEAMERGIETLGVFARFLAAYGLHGRAVRAIATSAIREASNRDELLERAQREARLRIEVLSAEAEAHLAYLAAVNTTTLADGVVLDLGGGSLQLIEVVNRQPHRVASFPLGAVRLTERFLPGDGPARASDLKRLRQHVKRSLRELPWLDEAGRRVVAIGGSARNLASAATEPSCPAELGIQGFRLSAHRLGQLADELARMPVALRRRHRGIKPGRGDIILAAATTLLTILDVGGFEALEVTEAGLREGAFFDHTLSETRLDVRRDSVLNLASQYEADLQHSQRVAELAVQMHDSAAEARLIDPHPQERELLWAAGMLHDVGMTISYDDHHKHSRYLILGAELPGFDQRERALIAQICRYHRKGQPKLGDLACVAGPEDEALLERCAVVLRIAEHLERGRDGSIRSARLRPEGPDVKLEAEGEFTLPRWSLDRYDDGEAFRRAFHRRLLVD